MFPTGSNMANSSNTIVTELRRIFPHSWAVEFSESPADDARLIVSPRRGASQRFAVEYKARFHPADLDDVLRHFERRREAGRPFLMSPHISPRSAELLKEFDVSYADERGNVHIASDTIFVDRNSNDNEKGSSGDLPRASLRGAITARIIRLLLDEPGPFLVRDVAKRTHVNPGTVSKLLAYLTKQRLIRRDERGSVTTADWRALIRAWAPALKSMRVVHSFFDPRGSNNFMERLRKTQVRYAVTGSFAAAKLAPVAYATAVDVYVPSPQEFARQLNLVSEPGVNNVRLIDPFDEVVFQHTIHRDDTSLCNPPQIAADLSTLPKRSDDEVDALLDWMAAHLSEWRDDRRL
jgi:hypothetical protein